MPNRQIKIAERRVMKREKLTLGIETSCDETAAAVIEGTRKIRSETIATQIPIHRQYGGVVPEIASRNHILSVLPVIDEAIKRANIEKSDIDQVAVTYGPGLAGALLVGVSAGKALAYALNVPLIGVNHLEGHIFANFLSAPELEPPFMALVVSGGHTTLVKVEGYNKFSPWGQTRDDAAGEAFDKVARVLGLPYPGGPAIDELAKEGKVVIDFPHALMKDGNYDFSFSGLKSAVLNYLNSAHMRGISVSKADVAASFQAAVVDVLVYKTIDAVKHSGLKSVAIAGGVAANSILNLKLQEAAKQNGIKFYFPGAKLCTDNAAMIACRGAYMAQDGLFFDLTLNAVPNLTL